MSLDWNLTKINNNIEVCWEKNEDGTDKLNPVTESLIWLTMGIGMGSITEENQSDFYCRVAMYEKLFGTMLSYWKDSKKVSVPITPEDIHNHIGLTTNVSKDTDASFRKRIVENFVREQKRKFQYALESED
jgi:hypothetical protein